MAKSKKVSRKLRHKRDVAQKRRARAFYRMREQDRQAIDTARSEDSTWADYVAIVAAVVVLVVLVAHAGYRLVKTIINM